MQSVLGRTLFIPDMDCYLKTLILRVKVQAAGIQFIGPDADTIEMMGDKIGSRVTMQAAGVPVVPGTDEGVASLEEAIRAAGLKSVIRLC